MMLLRLDPERLQKLIDDYEKAVIDIKKRALQMAWYMRGGATYEDILNMSATERQQINQIIEGNLEATKKSGMPFF
jgi:hypothetical protein